MERKGQLSLNKLPSFFAQKNHGVRPRNNFCRYVGSDPDPAFLYKKGLDATSYLQYSATNKCIELI